MGNYLGHTVGHGKLSVPECRVTALREFRQPVTKRDLRAFLGTAGYYRRFVKNFATIALPLIDATKKNGPTKIVWDDGMLGAFNILCNSLSDLSALVIPNQDDDFLLQTDASGRGIGAVLRSAVVVMSYLWDTTLRNSCRRRQGIQSLSCSASRWLEEWNTLKYTGIRSADRPP